MDKIKSQEPLCVERRAKKFPLPNPNHMTNFALG